MREVRPRRVIQTCRLPAWGIECVVQDPECAALLCGSRTVENSSRASALPSVVTAKQRRGEARIDVGGYAGSSPCRGARPGLPPVAEPRCGPDASVGMRSGRTGSFTKHRGADLEPGRNVRPDLPLLPRVRRAARLPDARSRASRRFQIARPPEGDEPVTLAYLDRRPAAGEGPRCREAAWRVRSLLPPRSRSEGARRLRT